MTTMTITPIVILGGGEHAQVVAEAIRSRPDLWELVGFTDPATSGPQTDGGRTNPARVVHEEIWPAAQSTVPVPSSFCPARSMRKRIDAE